MDDQCNSGGVSVVEDMEDMFGNDATDGVHRRLTKNVVVPKVKKRPSGQVKTTKPTEQSGDTPDQSSFLPGTHTVYLKTWGCTHNSSDSEYMAGQLAQQGYRYYQQNIVILPMKC